MVYLNLSISFINLQSYKRSATNYKYQALFIIRILRLHTNCGELHPLEKRLVEKTTTNVFKCSPLNLV